jgi:exoribonuclease R
VVRLLRTYANQMQEYWSIDKIQQGLANKTIFRGRLIVISAQKSLAFVSTDSLNVDIAIVDKSDRNRAQHDDIVFVELYPVDSWLNTKLIKQDSQDQLNSDTGSLDLWRPRDDLLNQTNKSLGDGDVIEFQPNSSTILQPKGRIVGVSHEGVSSPRTLVGTLHSSTYGPTIPLSKFPVLFRPTNNQYEPMLISNAHLPPNFSFSSNVDASLFVSTVQSWPINSPVPLGGRVRPFSSLRTIPSQIQEALAEYGIVDGICVFHSFSF